MAITRAALLFALIVGDAKAGAPNDKSTVAAIVSKVQKVYGSMSDLHVRFDQVTVLAVGMTRKRTGEIWSKPPRRMLLRCSGPDQTTVVADGDVLWTHEPQSRQVLRQSYASLPFPFSLIATPQKLDIDYSVSIADSTTVGRPGDIVLRMVPKDRRHLPKDLLVAVDPQTGIIGSLVFHDRAGSSVEMTFTDVEVNVGQDDTKFRFSVPAATQVLRGTPLP